MTWDAFAVGRRIISSASASRTMNGVVVFRSATFGTGGVDVVERDEHFDPHRLQQAGVTGLFRLRFTSRTPVIQTTDYPGRAG